MWQWLSPDGSFPVPLSFLSLFCGVLLEGRTSPALLLVICSPHETVNKHMLVLHNCKIWRINESNLRFISLPSLFMPKLSYIWLIRAHSCWLLSFWPILSLTMFFLFVDHQMPHSSVHPLSHLWHHPSLEGVQVPFNRSWCLVSPFCCSSFEKSKHLSFCLMEHWSPSLNKTFACFSCL